MIALLAQESLLDRMLEVLMLRAGYNTTLVLIGTVLLGIASAMIGSFLLLRGRALIADALSHAALPGVCFGFLIGVWLGFEDRSLWILLPAAAIAGLIGVGCVHLIATLPRVKEDAAIGAVLSVFFALGIVLLKAIEALPVGGRAGLDRFIFGSASSMIRADLSVIMVLATVCAIMPLVMFKELRLVCFDRAFAQSLGWSTLALDGVLLGLVTLATVAGLNAVGAILMVALLVIPASAARFWTERLGRMILIAGVIGALGSWLGTTTSVVVDRVPTGPAIVVACGTLFVVSMIFAPCRGLLMRWVQHARTKRSIGRAHLLRAIYECGEVVGDVHAHVPIGTLRARRRWTTGRLTRLLRAAHRRDEVALYDGSASLTPFGASLAARIVRTHRLWEHYLTTRADVAPSHVDRAADTIEHVLGDEIVERIEDALIREGHLEKHGEMPGSPHAIIDVSEARP